MHPMGALVVGAVAGALFVFTFTLAQNKWRIDDVLGVWPLHGLCGVWGGIAAGIYCCTISCSNHSGSHRSSNCQPLVGTIDCANDCSLSK